jgi:ribose/xylose/arabinose/galactoside ABC-type transport system permease subunit
VERHRVRLSPGFQAAFFVLLGLGETFALILSEIDLSVGFVAGVGATITVALVSPSLSITILTVAVAGAAGALLVIVCNLNRGNLVALRGVPWVLPGVLIVVVAWTLLLSKTRTGRYI